VYELELRGPKNIALAIVGNKADLTSMREVEESTARAYANDIGAIFLEASAKDNSAVADIFVGLTEILPPPATPDPNSIRTTSIVQPGKESGSRACGSC
jgi:hypothetical protein